MYKPAEEQAGETSSKKTQSLLPLIHNKTDNLYIHNKTDNLYLISVGTFAFHIFLLFCLLFCEQYDCGTWKSQHFHHLSKKKSMG